MKIKEELRTFSDEVYDLALEMMIVVDAVNLGTVDAKQAAAQLDVLARDVAATADSIKTLAYRMGRGEDRVMTVTVPKNQVPS